VYRHLQDHISTTLVKAQEAQEVARADTLLDQVRSIQNKALAVLTAAEAAGDLRAALGAIREARGNLELLGKLTGELRERAIDARTVVEQQYITISPDTIAAAMKALQEVREMQSGSAVRAPGQPHSLNPPM